MNSQILCDIGDGQNMTENLSTFSAHITNALDILRRVNRESLVVMNELGSGTDPAEGMGIADCHFRGAKKERVPVSCYHPLSGSEAVRENAEESATREWPLTEKR